MFRSPDRIVFKDTNTRFSVTFCSYESCVTTGKMCLLVRITVRAIREAIKQQ